MARCARCCLQNSLRIVNLITNLLGIAIIVYSLWLQRKWNDGVAHFPTTAHLPRPLFIYTCLGIGIVVCLSTLVGYTIANCISNSTLCIYILVIGSLVLLEVAVVVSIYFCRDWQAKFIEYIDKYHTNFTSFVTFHIKMCRLITLMILIPQINIIALGIMLWIIGTEQGMERHDPDTPTVTQSFLVGSYYSIMPNASQQHRNTCGNFNGEYESRENFWSHIKSAIRFRFQRSSFAH